MPVIAAVSGFCLGMGIDIITACDIRLCTQDSKFSIKEVDIGICADLGTIQRFQKVTGNDSWLRELAYTARVFGAEEAAKHGLVSTVYSNKEDVLKAAFKIAETIATKSPLAINITK